MDFGSIKNVGIAAVEAIVNTRGKEGAFENFRDFLERIAGETVNKKCVESLIKAGAFDEFGHTRATLLASFELMMDTISLEYKKGQTGQISFFDLGTDEEKEEMNEIRYKYIEHKEIDERELLLLEKEMMGFYLSGHPLEVYRKQIENEKNKICFTKDIHMMNSEEETESEALKDGDNIKLIGIISSIDKKYTKTNKLLIKILMEDLYGSVEVLMFENAYMESSQYLIEDNVVMLDGRITVKEDGITIFTSKLEEYIIKEEKTMTIDLNDVSEEVKDKLRNSIRYYAKDKNKLNTDVAVKIGDEIKSCGRIYLDTKTEEMFIKLIGNEKIKIEKVEFK